MARRPPRPGDTYGLWKVMEQIGAGGNGTVHRVQRLGDREGTVAALKLLSGRSDERRGRFLNEIRFLLSGNGAIPGVLRLIDHHFSESSREPSWYVMPIAQPILQALGPAPKPETCVDAARSFSRTLAALHGQGIAHRDLKPGNLFHLDDAWVLGDFGLVKYPNGDHWTLSDRRLGPADFMAPEMRRDADKADATPADVYSLAKVLWVLLTGSDLPFLGQYALDDRSTSLRARTSYGRAGELDELIHRATCNDPRDRPTAEDFTMELNAVLAPPPERAIQPAIGDLAKRLRGLVVEETNRSTALRRSIDQAGSSFAPLKDCIDRAFATLTPLLPDHAFVKTGTELYRAVSALATMPVTGLRPLSYGGIITVNTARGAYSIVAATCVCPPHPPDRTVDARVAVEFTRVRDWHSEQIAGHRVQGELGSAQLSNSVNGLTCIVESALTTAIQRLIVELQQ